MSARRVVVTGLGIVCPVGNTVEEAWQNIVAAKSGITQITRFDAAAFASRIAGEVKDFNIAAYVPGKEARRMDTFIHYGIAASMQAIATRAQGRELRSGADRLRDRLRDWRLAAHRRNARRTYAWRTAQDFAVLRSGQHHQHDRRAPLDHVRLAGSEPRDRYRMYHGEPLHWRGRAVDRAR